MSNTVPAIAREPRRLASIFDDIPPGTPPSLDELEAAIDTERRCLAALDRALARLAVPIPPTLTSLGRAAGRPNRRPDLVHA